MDQLTLGTLSRVNKVYQELYKSIRAYCHIVICIAMYYHI